MQQIAKTIEDGSPFITPSDARLKVIQRRIRNREAAPGISIKRANSGESVATIFIAPYPREFQDIKSDRIFHSAVKVETNHPTAQKNLQILVPEIWHPTGHESVDITPLTTSQTIYNQPNSRRIRLNPVSRKYDVLEDGREWEFGIQRVNENQPLWLQEAVAQWYENYRPIPGVRLISHFMRRASQLDDNLVPPLLDTNGQLNGEYCKLGLYGVGNMEVTRRKINAITTVIRALSAKLPKAPGIHSSERTQGPIYSAQVIE